MRRLGAVETLSSELSRVEMLSATSEWFWRSSEAVKSFAVMYIDGVGSCVDFGVEVGGVGAGRFFLGVVEVDGAWKGKEENRIS